MPFKPGHKKMGGMKKGAITRDRQMLLDKAKELGVDPFEILLRIANNDWKGLGYKKEGQTVHTAGGGSFYQPEIDCALRAKAAADACQYMLPKLKSIDITQTEDEGPINIQLNLSAGYEPQPQSHGSDKTSNEALPKP
jgi:hypothetical protein